jgi:CheY-like chemotaxis protein
VVEDEPSVREIAVSLLRDLGYQVIEAPDATAGLALFEAEPDRFDLLLTDVVLPGPMRGRELAERAQALRPCLPVLFMSGYTENAILHHGRLDDGVNLISKPFKRDQLAQKVAEVLARSADT